MAESEPADRAAAEDHGLRARVEAEWFNGNLDEDCRDRLLAAIGDDGRGGDGGDE
jgi:hypothetical protein